MFYSFIMIIKMKNGVFKNILFFGVVEKRVYDFDNCVCVKCCKLRICFIFLYWVI